MSDAIAWGIKGAEQFPGAVCGVGALLRLGRRARAGALILLLLLTVLGAGCDSHPQTGSARIEAWAVNGAAFARVVATVSAGEGAGFAPITSEMQKNGAEWWCDIGQIPAGKRRRFDVVAYGAGGAVLSAATTFSDIVPGTTLVSILLQLQSPHPVIDAVVASACVVAPAGQVRVAATAHDPEGGPLTYRWNASCGAFDAPNEAAATWTAPTSEGTCRLSISVANRVGVSVVASVDVVVRAPAGGVDVQVRVDTWPVIAGFSASVFLGPTLEGDLEVDARDADGDPLTFVWTTNCPGLAFDVMPPHSASSPHVSLPGPSEECAILLTVSDPDGGSAPASMVLPPNRGFGAGG